MPTANTDRALLVLRLVVGVAFAAHGYQKLFGMGPDGVATFFATLDIPMASLAAWAVSLLEFAGGIALILGIFTRGTAALLAVTMVGAIWFAKRTDGFFDFELEFVLAGVSLALALAGAGAHSVDARMRRSGPSA
jgi:putative oxidoreductase